MDLYSWVLVLHVASLAIFFVSHGAAAAVAFRLRRERDPARVRTLLELSSSAVGITMSVSLLIGFAAGIWLGFLGNWWGQGWIWASIAVLIVVAVLMTPLAAMPLRRLRAAAGIVPRKGADSPAADDAELERLLSGWNPWPTAAVGAGAIVVLVWLMFFKPF